MYRLYNFFINGPNNFALSDNFKLTSNLNSEEFKKYLKYYETFHTDRKKCLKNKNIRTPHIGKVILKEGVEIGANSTIDRGSMSDTIIEKNTFLDNQVHVAHNVRIGKNCMIAGQVGFAGSTILGDNVVIGGQAGISGHLKIGDNVRIGGGSGVINDISDNEQVMGYPAIPLREFIKKRNKNEK